MNGSAEETIVRVARIGVVMTWPPVGSACVPNSRAAAAAGQPSWRLLERPSRASRCLRQGRRAARAVAPTRPRSEIRLLRPIPRQARARSARSLHADERLCHGRLFGPREAGEFLQFHAIAGRDMKATTASRDDRDQLEISVSTPGSPASLMSVVTTVVRGRLFLSASIQGLLAIASSIH